MALFHSQRIVLAALNIVGSILAVADAQSFSEIIAADPNLTALSTVLATAQVNLSDAFTSPVTFLAPTNDAFAEYSDVLVKYSDEQYIAHLQNLLLMHVVEGEVLSTDLRDGQRVTAVNGEDIRVTITDGTVTLSTADNNANVVVVDVPSSDGVLHQIDGLLLPSFISTGLLDLTNMVDGFSIVQELLEYTGLAALFGPDLTATVFAPSDAAFNELPEGALEYYRTNKGIATKLLSGHVISPQIIPTQNMVNGNLPVTTPAGTTLTIEILEVEGETIYYVNNATMTMTNILANNGIIHALAAVLDVPGTEYPPPATAPTVSTPTVSPTSAPSSLDIEKTKAPKTPTPKDDDSNDKGMGKDKGRMMMMMMTMGEKGEMMKMMGNKKGGKAMGQTTKKT